MNRIFLHGIKTSENHISSNGGTQTNPTASKNYISNNITDISIPKWFYDVYSITLGEELDGESTRDNEYLRIILPIKTDEVADNRSYMFTFTGYDFANSSIIDAKVIFSVVGAELSNAGATGTNEVEVYADGSGYVVVRLKSSNWFGSSISMNYFSMVNDINREQFATDLRDDVVVKLGYVDFKDSLQERLIAHYPMQNIEGDKLIDETGNYDATIYGATQVNEGLSFDDNYIDIGVINEDTFAVYFDLASINNIDSQMVLISNWYPSNFSFLVDIYNNSVRVIYRDHVNDSSILISTPIDVTSTNNEVLAVYDLINSKIKVIVNEVVSEVLIPKFSTINDKSKSIWIGASQVGDASFEGIIRKIRIYNESPTEEKIAALYNSVPHSPS